MLCFELTEREVRGGRARWWEGGREGGRERGRERGREGGKSVYLEVVQTVPRAAALSAI